MSVRTTLIFSLGIFHSPNTSTTTALTFLAVWGEASLLTARVGFLDQQQHIHTMVSELDNTHDLHCSKDQTG